jgi:ribosome biogenesis GTPase A
LINKKFSQEVESFFFDKEFAKAQSIADKKI